MQNRTKGKAANRAADGEQVTREFVRLYYGILNNHPGQLFQFYGSDSTCIVSEFGATLPSQTETADTREKIRTLLGGVFKGVTSKIKTALPQPTVDGGLLLLVSGTLTKAASSSKDGGQHCFTQALVLAPQKNGYYILNDTIHIMGSLTDSDAIEHHKKERDESVGFANRFYPTIGGGNSIVPNTPRLNGHASPAGGGRRSTSSEGGTQNEIKSDSDSDASSDRAPNPPATKSRTFQQIAARAAKPFRAVQASTRVPQRNALPVGVSVGVLPPQPGHVAPKPGNNRGEARPMPVPPGHGVFIARLPFGIQANDVEKAFSVFGPVLNGADGIQVRDGRNGCYAFVTFESCSSAQAAIDKGAIVQGKRVYVEPRYPRQDAADQVYTRAPPPPPPLAQPSLSPPLSAAAPMPPQMLPVQLAPN